MTEKQIQNAIFHAFGTRSDMRLYRRNIGVMKAGAHFVQFGEKGQADLWGFIHGGMHLEIEVKTPTGQQTVEQKQWERICRRFGVVYILARSVDDVWAVVGKYLNKAA